jgi:hypothetical protein
MRAPRRVTLALLALASSAACVPDEAVPSGEPGRAVAGAGGKADAVCEREDAAAMFDAWAARQPATTPNGSAWYVYALDGIVEPGPAPTFAIRRQAWYGVGFQEDSYLLMLDADGGERATAPGRFLDRLGPDAFLVDASRASVYDDGSHDPLYRVDLVVQAVDRDGATLWTIPGRANVALSRVVRLDDDHFMIHGRRHDTTTVLTFFDSDGVVSEPPEAGAELSCSRGLGHVWCPWLPEHPDADCYVR